MKRVLATVLVFGTLVACNNEAGTSDNKVDSLNERKDTLLEKVDSTADAKIDSIKTKTEELKDKFDSSIEAKKDSLKH